MAGGFVHTCGGRSEGGLEEGVEVVEGDEVGAVVEVDVVGAGDDEEALGFGGAAVGVFAELAGVGLGAGDEEDGAGTDEVEVLEGIEVHEADVAGEGGLGGGLARGAGGCEFAAGRAVPAVELQGDGVGGLFEGQDGAADVFGLGAGGLGGALGGGLGAEGLTRREVHGGGLESVAGGRAHVIHAGGGDGFDARVDFGGGQGETAAAADADGADAFGVGEGLGGEPIDGGGEALGVEVGRDKVTRAFAGAPAEEVDGEGGVAAFGEFDGVEVGGLFLHGAHGVADDDCGQTRTGCGVFGQVEVRRDLEAELAGEGDGLRGDAVTGIEVVCAGGNGRQGGWLGEGCAGEGYRGH